MQRKRANDENDASTTQTKRRRQAPEQIKSQIALVHEDKNEGVRSGKIIRIHLTNFMCHGNLQIDFNPQVNLLIGRNGSGKSAILTALIVGLGAKASKTSRSGQLKNFIKAGENSATIEIEIANVGVGAYNSDTFGQKIIIKRKITPTSSAYEIKDAYGHVVSKSREDLMKIMLFHNIQTDNPVFVLNQDAARSFLRDMVPKKNYELFLKATQMEIILEKLNKCVQLYNKYKAKLTVSTKQLEHAEKELRELEVKYERLKSVEEIKQSINLYKLQRLWLRVTEQEKKIANLQNEITAKETERDKINDKINSNSSDVSLKERLKDLQRECDEKNSLLQGENRALINLQNAYKEANCKYQVEQQQRVKLRDRCKRIEEEIETINEEISKRKESNSSQITQKRLQVDQEKKRLENQRQEVESMIATLKQDLRLNAHNKERQTEEYESVKMQKKSLQHKIASNEQELTRMGTLSNDRLEVYGQHMKSLIQMIEKVYNNRKFSALPKGPLGRYLEVPDKKWRGVVEQLLGGHLTSFIVNNGQDRQVLDKIIKTHFPQSRHTIITAKFRGQQYNVQDGSVPKIRGAHLLLDLIKCSDPDVINCLIDQINIETIVLVEDQNLAVQLTKDESQVPANLRKVVLLNPLIEYFPSPLYRAYSLEPRNPRYMQVNIDDRKKALRDEILRNKELQEQIDQKLQSFRQKLGDFEEYQKKNQTLLRKHESSMNDIKLQIEELNNYEFPSENENEVLRNEVQKLENSRNLIETKLKEKESNCMELKQAAQEKHQAVQKQQEKIKSFEREVNSLMEELNANKLEAAKKGNSLRTLTAKLSQLEEDISKLKTLIANEEPQLSEYHQEASNNGERVDTDKSNSELNHLIKSLEVKMKQICSIEENIHDVAALVEDKRLKFQTDQQLMQTISDSLVLLKKSRQQRFRTLKCLLEHMAIRVSHTFKHILKLRDFDGELSIDHAEKTLTMTIVPRDKHIKNAVSNTKSLSGGERSFSTVALLLSLWSCIDHPFYFLDEYDVFTDEFNRKVITQLLLNEAKKKSHRQYTFLSPQDMSFVEASNWIKIHRMADPRSSQ